MPRTRPTGTLKDLNKYLKNNLDASVAEAKKAVNYKGEPVKPKAGNTTNNRAKLRMGKRGTNGDHERKKLLKVRPPQSKEEVNRNRRQNYKRLQLNKEHGKGKFVIDHIYSLNKLGQELWGVGERLVGKTIDRIEAVHGPVGDRPQNRRIISSGQNEQYRQAEKAGLENKPKSKAKPTLSIPSSRGTFSNNALRGAITLKSVMTPASRAVNTGLGGPAIFIP